ncbi:MAG: PAS domain S-box protein, partial [Bacteroidota bacterium]
IAREKENAQTYMEMAGSLIIVIERDEKVKLVNREGSRLLGYEEKEIVGKNWFDHFIPPAEREEVRGVFHKVLNGEMAHVEFYENRILNQQGEPRLIRWYNRVLRREDGSIIGSISSGVDITEQKKAEQLLKNYAQQLEEDVRIQTEQLSLSEAKLTEASKMAKTGYWELDLRGERPVANFSKEYCQLYEVAEGANQGDPRYFLQFVNEADRQEVQELARKGMATGENQQFDFQITTARGNEKYLRAQLNCIKDEQGRVVRTFSVVQDITDQKLAAIQLETALASERELGQLKSRFVSMASHEFPTPLSSIMSSVSLIEMYTEKGIHDKNLKHIRRIQSSVNNLTTILNDFLSLEKLESGKVQVKPEQVDIGDFIEELQEGLGAMLREGQRVEHHHEGDTMVQVDPHLLKNILINLCSNAIKYSPNGEKVCIRSTNAEQQLSIEVIDRGIGIPEADQKHMFSRFFRAANAANIKGTGLGLTIVKRY